MRNIERFRQESHTEPPLYHYRECGLDYVWLLDGFRLEKTDENEFLFIEDQEDLHRALALSIIERGDGMTGRELWFLRHELNLSHAQLARFIRADVQVVARWEKEKAAFPARPTGSSASFISATPAGQSTLMTCSRGSTRRTPCRGTRWYSNRQRVVGTWRHKPLALHAWSGREVSSTARSGGIQTVLHGRLVKALTHTVSGATLGRPEAHPGEARSEEALCH